MGPGYWERGVDRPAYWGGKIETGILFYFFTFSFVFFLLSVMFLSIKGAECIFEPTETDIVPLKIKNPPQT